MHLLVIISGYLLKMVLPALAGAALCLASLPLRRRRLRGQGRESTWEHEVGLALLVAFGCGLFALIVLPSGRPAGGLHYNLIPFQIFFDVAEEVRLGNVLGLVISFLGNIVMFMPLGFFPALLWRGVGWRRAVLIGFWCSLTIELCQLPLGRSSDVDDLWLNTLGSAAGYGMYHLLDSWKPLWTKACKVKDTDSKEEE